MSIFKHLKRQILNEEGFSVIEALLASSVFALIVTALIGAYLYGLQGTAGAGTRARAVFLADEAIEAIRSIRDEAWNEIRFNQSGIDSSSNEWDFLGEGTTEVIDIFTRTITYNSVCRDGSDNIVACPGSYTDPHTKEVVVEITWDNPPGIPHTITRNSYITNWHAAIWTQTDWSGGSGQSTWSDVTRYDSDDGNVNIGTAGEISLNSTGGGACGTNWTFDTPTNYTYDSGKIEVTGGYAQLVASTSGAGEITDTVVDTLEYDTSESREPYTLHIDGNIFAVAYRGPGRDGFVKTVEIDTSGNITNSVVDTLEFNTTEGREPSMVHVSGDVYAIAYRGSGADGFVTTVEIASNGQITNSVIDTYEYNTSAGIEPSMVHVSGDIYAIAHRGAGNDGFIRTVEIATNGNITNSVIDTYEFDTRDTIDAHMIHISGNVFAIAYREDSSDDGFLRTVEIASNGNITNSIIDSQEFDTSNGGEPFIMSVSGDVYAIANRGNGNDGFLRTMQIAANGQITNTPIDTYEYDTSSSSDQTIIQVDGDIYAIAYRGSGGDGFVRTVEIATNGSITTPYVDSLEFDTSDARGTFIIPVTTSIAAIFYQGSGTDGFVKTIEIQSGTSYPSDNPTINPTTSYTGMIASWDGFVETASKDGGDIYYQLSDDDGSTWYYWDGASWATAGASNYNTASVIDSNISSFSATNNSMMFKAFLESDGSQFVQLADVEIQCTGGVGTTTVSVRVSTGNDDAEEQNPPNGSMYRSSSDLELVSDGSTDQEVGMRFQNITIPQGATISSARIDFTVDETNSGTTNIVFYGEDTDDALSFSSSSGDITNRSKTTASVAWNNVPSWTTIGSVQSTPNLSNIIQEIVDRPTWSSGNAMAIIVDGTGERTAESYDGSTTQAPLLVIEYSTGGGVSFTDDNATDFNAGTYNLSQWDGGNSWVELTAAGQTGGSGDFESQIFDAGVSVPWTGLSWEPQRPTLKQLPGSGVTESVYTQGNIAMTGNQVLLHLNESAGQTSFSDNSGNGNSFNCSGGNCPTAGSGGTFNTSVTYDGSNDYITTPTDLNQWLGGTASVSYWIKTTQTGAGLPWQSPGITGVESAGDGNDIFWGWINNSGYLGFSVSDYGVLSASPINDNEWHHIFLSRDQGSGLIKLYVDGVLNNQGTFDTDIKTTSFYDIGRIDDTGGTPQYFNGSLDEFAVWDSVLSDAEVLDMYLRGSLTIRFHVRSCNDASCSGEVFVGPDGSSATYYSELDNSSTDLPTFSLTNVPNNRYIQYKAFFGTGDSSYSPELKSVTVTGGSSSGSYVTGGSLLSSAYDMGKPSSVEIIEWSEDLSSCTGCSIQFQVRTAPDVSGTPGSWTNWYGSTGSGTYFTSSDGSIISLDLNGNQWVQYRVELAGDGSSTPILQDVSIFYK